MTVRIGTRGSDLALWQARWVAERLAPTTDTELVVIQTRGDAIDTRPLSKVEGKAFFTGEIERALLDGDVDLAVHSHKDLETVSDPALAVVAVPARGLVHERLVLNPSAHDAAAPLLPLISGAKVGTSAPRRRVQLHTLRPDLELAELRGNVPTRVERLREGRYDAVLLAAAGLERLALDTSGLVVADLLPELLVPAPAQGALAIQIRAADSALATTLREAMHDLPTADAIRAERWLLTQAGGGCQIPLGALIEPQVDADGGPAGHRCLLFLGRGHPQEGEPSRWVETRGDDPRAAAEAAWERVLSGKPTGAGPLSGLVAALVGSAEGGSGLATRLEQLGATVRHEKVLEFREVKAPELPAKLARLKPGDVLAVTSQEAARRLSGHRVPTGVAVAAVGPGTAHALSASGLRPTVVGKGGARALAGRIEVGDGGHVLFPCALEARPELPDALRERGIEVDRIVLYRTVASKDADLVEEADVVVFMSPSSVATSVGEGRESRRLRVVRVGLGKSTCDALQDEGLAHERPHGSGPEATVALLCQLFDPSRRRPAGS